MLFEENVLFSLDLLPPNNPEFPLLAASDATEANENVTGFVAIPPAVGALFVATLVRVLAGVIELDFGGSLGGVF